mmetsp:Transcript_33299/g.80312  ORF Transcript_33299/g.80312 Transcript_33299/m.80312 type:complete len:267 (-) Transcript_33299:1108-1908(-)
MSPTFATSSFECRSSLAMLRATYPSGHGILSDHWSGPLVPKVPTVTSRLVACAHLTVTEQVVDSHHALQPSSLHSKSLTLTSESSPCRSILASPIGIYPDGQVEYSLHWFTCWWLTTFPLTSFKLDALPHRAATSHSTLWHQALHPLSLHSKSFTFWLAAPPKMSIRPSPNTSNPSGQVAYGPHWFCGLLTISPLVVCKSTAAAISSLQKANAGDAMATLNAGLADRFTKAADVNPVFHSNPEKENESSLHEIESAAVSSAILSSK